VHRYSISLPSSLYSNVTFGTFASVLIRYVLPFTTFVGCGDAEVLAAFVGAEGVERLEAAVFSLADAVGVVVRRSATVVFRRFVGGVTTTTELLSTLCSLSPSSPLSSSSSSSSSQSSTSFSTSSSTSLSSGNSSSSSASSSA
jgi:hypothetical protein